MADESKLYVIELTDDERVWLSELVDSRAHELNNLLIGAIGDDREAWLTEVNIADRVGEEDCLAVRPTEGCLVESRDSEHALALSKAEERCRVLEEALTPSESTKAAYMGEFQFRLGEIPTVNVPWVTIKKIMEAIRERARAALEGK